MTFLLDSLKEKFGTEDEEEGEDGFDDLNYKVGNTSGMDVTQQIPSELAERVGQMAQRGGGEMEIQVENPSTFHIDRDDLLNVVNGLGIDISIHSDPNVGYTSPYQVGEGGGFDGTHKYFTQYLEAFTSMKLDAENRAGLDFGDGDNEISIGRINPHVSVSPLPQTEQERAQGVGLDPFGYNIGEVKKGVYKERTKKGENIFRNPDFMRRFYRLFVRDELEGNEWRYFEGLYNSYSNKFDKKWRDAKNEVLQEIWETRTGINGDSQLKDKAEILSIAARAPVVKDKWLDLIGDDEGEFEGNGVEVKEEFQEVGKGLGFDKEKIEDLEDLDQFTKTFLGQRYQISEVGRLQEFIYFMEAGKIERMISSQTRSRIYLKLEQDGIDGEEILKGMREEIWKKAKPALIEAINELWKADDPDDEMKVSLIPVDTKTQAVTRQLEIPNERIPKRAFKKENEELKDEAENLYAGEDLSYFSETLSDGENEDEEELREKHRRFLEDLSRQFEQQMWQASSLFYRIVPAWLDVAHKKSPGHEGWKGPKFLWKILIERKWGEKENVDLDLRNPRSENGDDMKRYFDLLEESREFQMDVAAAVAGTYMWSMFTQEEGEFELDDRYLLSVFDLEGEKNDEELVNHVKRNGWTWIDWMNRFGIGVNMETMAGDPRQFFKLWRPIHVVAACRAINITARRRLDPEEGTGELGGLSEMRGELDDCPVKFTIDMEHVSSFGVDPLDEMEKLKDMEKELIENPVEINGEEIETPGDPEKPLAKMVRMYHLTKPGHETTGGVGHTHGPFRKGDTDLYKWLYKLVEWGFGRGDERASVMYEVGGDQTGTVYQAKLSMNLIELGVSHNDLDPSKVEPGKDYDSRKEALMARFFNMDKSHFSSEWAKIEANAFAPLDGLLEAKTFDKTRSGTAALEEGELRPQQWPQEEYK